MKMKLVEEGYRVFHFKSNIVFSPVCACVLAVDYNCGNYCGMDAE